MREEYSRDETSPQFAYEKKKNYAQIDFKQVSCGDGESVFMIVVMVLLSNGSDGAGEGSNREGWQWLW